MNCEKKIWIVFSICCIVAVVLLERFGPVQPSPYENISECEALMPQAAPFNREEEPPNVELDFSKKENLYYGKYGFRKTFEISETSIFEQEILLSYGSENVHFGIYTDSKLLTPLQKRSMKEQIRVNIAVEMGAPLEELHKHPDDITIVLEPGTYYLAAYSTDEDETDIVTYRSRIAPVKTEIALKENEWKYFFSAGKDYKTYFSIHVDEPTVLELEENIGGFVHDVVLCNSDKKPIRKAVIKSNKSKDKAEIEVLEAGDYYLEVAPIVDEPSCWAYGIRYMKKKG